MAVTVDTRRPTVTMGDPVGSNRERIARIEYARVDRRGRRIAPRVIELRVWCGYDGKYWCAAMVDRRTISTDTRLPLEHWCADADTHIDPAAVAIDRWIAANPNYVRA